MGFCNRDEKWISCLALNALFEVAYIYRGTAVPILPNNRAAFKKIFREFVILCRRLDLFGRELLAVDGTRIKAVNNKDRNFTTGSLQKFIEAVDKKLEDYLKRLDAGDAEECATSGSRVKNLAEKIEALKKKRGEYAANLTAL